MLSTCYEQVYAQLKETLSWEEILVQLSNNQIDKNETIEGIEELREYYQQPVNINIITKQQLEQFPFLSNQQIENILYYRYINESFTTLYELQLVENMDRITIEYLLPFIYLGPSIEKQQNNSIKKRIKYGKHSFSTRITSCLNKKKGYESKTGYIGNSLYHQFKYNFHYKDKLEWGIVLEKDPGEAIFTTYSKGYDYYSLYLFLRDYGKIKTLALGNYRLRFGMGLLMNTYFGLGKSSSMATLGYRSSGIYKHSSTDEWNYLRGVALCYKLSTGLLATVYYSNKNLDATVNKGVITGLKKDGFHRTISEMNKRNKAVLNTSGFNLSYHSSYLNLGFNFVYNVFNKPLIKGNKLYQLYDENGSNFINVSMSYRYRYQQLLIYGETAMNQLGRIATINAVRFTPLSGCTILAIYRYYDKAYTAFQAKSISEGGKVRNESGYLLHITAHPYKYITLTNTFDFFHFPWLTYRINKPSSGFESNVKLNYCPKNNLSMNLRYFYQQKYRNKKGNSSLNHSISCYEQQKWQYQLNYKLGIDLNFSTTLAYATGGYEKEKKEKGIMLFQGMNYKAQKLPFSLHLSYGLFDTESYATAMRIYEYGPLYSFSIPTFVGKGMRFAATFRYDIRKKWMFLIKLAHTNYSDREKIGSGNETIAGNTKTEVSFQVRFQLK